MNNLDYAVELTSSSGKVRNSASNCNIMSMSQDTVDLVHEFKAHDRMLELELVCKKLASPLSNQIFRIY